MLKTPNGTATDAVDLETTDVEATVKKPAENTNGRKPVKSRLPGALNGHEAIEEVRPVLAVFCYEDPDSVVGQFVAKTLVALAKRKVVVHLFSRRDFDLDAAGVFCNALGECAGEGTDLVADIHEFASRACNAFLKTFPAGYGRVTLLGHEWSTIPALSLLRGIKRLDTILALHSLECQRSDLTSDLSKQIEEIERTGLREAKTVLCHDAVTVEAARKLVPDCAERITPMRERFPAEQFEKELDPGSIKARYQVGPLDPVILYVGDLEERYGPDLLVKAMPAVLKNHPQARLIVVGDGSFQWPVRVYTRYLLLEHAVRIVGTVQGEALSELIRAADVVVVPSRESTPWWPIQAAWAAGRPVVVTHPAAPNLVEHEKTGVLCYPAENSCVWGIERLLYDENLRKTLAEKGREKLEERFGWNCVAAQLEELVTVAAR